MYGLRIELPMNIIRDAFLTHDPKTAVICCLFHMAQSLNRCAVSLNRVRIGVNWEARSLDDVFLRHIIENEFQY